jgi:hypothetical protein
MPDPIKSFVEEKKITYMHFMCDLPNIVRKLLIFKISKHQV